MKSKQLHFFLFTIALFLAIISPKLFSDGMFVDGVVYSAIAKNLSNNIGSFWSLEYTKTLYPTFHEHPPLAFWLQSLFFRVLGDSIFTERIYSILSYVISGFILVKLWNEFSLNEYKSISWFPLLLWLLVPVVGWSLTNNILENTMGIFVLLSLLFMARSIKKQRFLFLFLAGFSLFLAFLTKGFVALFPLSFLFWLTIFSKDYKFKRFILDSSTLLFSTLFPFLLLQIFIPEAIENIIAYINKQVVGSLNNIQTVDTRLFILGRLVSELIPILLLSSVVLIVTRKLSIKQKGKSWAYTFFALALSGVIPIMISMKQSGFYILATFPFFALAFAYFFANRVGYLTESIKIKTWKFNSFKIITYLLVIGSISSVIFHTNKKGRDSQLILSIEKVTEHVGAKNTISVQPLIWGNWELNAYFARNSDISLDPKVPFNKDYLLVSKGWKGRNMKAYKKVQIDMQEYELFRKIK